MPWQLCGPAVCAGGLPKSCQLLRGPRKVFTRKVAARFCSCGQVCSRMGPAQGKCQLGFNSLVNLPLRRGGKRSPTGTRAWESSRRLGALLGWAHWAIGPGPRSPNGSRNAPQGSRKGSRKASRKARSFSGNLGPACRGVCDGKETCCPSFRTRPSRKVPRRARRKAFMQRRKVPARMCRGP